MDWQSMNSAPKDGREVLLQVELRAGVTGKCLVGHYMPGGHCIEDHPPIDAGWYFWNGCMFDKASEPVKWCELPPEKTSATTVQQMDTQAAIAHLKTEGFDVYEAVPAISEMTDAQLKEWRIKIVAWGQDIRHRQAHLSDEIHREIERRDAHSSCDGTRTAERSEGPGQ